MGGTRLLQSPEIFFLRIDPVLVTITAAGSSFSERWFVIPVAGMDRGKKRFGLLEEVTDRDGGDAVPDFGTFYLHPDIGFKGLFGLFI